MDIINRNRDCLFKMRFKTQKILLRSNSDAKIVIYVKSKIMFLTEIASVACVKNAWSRS